MSDDTAEKTAVEVRRLRKLLRSISQLSEHASLTGALKHGAADAVIAYNRVLARIEELDIAPAGFFAPLPEDVNFDRLGVNARLLSDYIKEDDYIPGVHGAHAGHPNVVIGSLAGIDGLGELKDIGKMVRTKLAGIFNDDPELAGRYGKVKVEVKVDRKDGSEEETIREDMIG